MYIFKKFIEYVKGFVKKDIKSECSIDCCCGDIRKFLQPKKKKVKK